jgi:outer membrane protein OmpU
MLAHAQSSVTLYGIIDEGITYVSNEGGSHNVKLDDGVLYGNRWGLKGSEDLGGGMKAIFTLEGGYSLNTGKLGQGGLGFGRQAYVGLAAGWGTITAGRQYDSITDFITAFSPSLNGTGYGTHQGDYDRVAGERLNNTVKYMSPDFSGFNFGGLYSFSNTAGNFHDGSAYTLGAGYAHGPFKMGIAYGAYFKPTFDPFAAIGVSSFLGQTTATTNAATGVTTDSNSSLVIESSKLSEIAASYAVNDALTVYGVFTHNALKGFGRTDPMNVYETGIQYVFTPAWRMYAAYQHDTFEGHAWNQATASAWYSLSKATSLYAGFEYLRASSGVDPVVGYSFTPSTSNVQAIVRIGMFHTF